MYAQYCVDIIAFLVYYMLNPWLLSMKFGVDVWPLLGCYQSTLEQMYAESLAAINELWGGCMPNIVLVSGHSWLAVC